LIEDFWGDDGELVGSVEGMGLGGGEVVDFSVAED